MSLHGSYTGAECQEVPQHISVLVGSHGDSSLLIGLHVGQRL